MVILASRRTLLLMFAAFPGAGARKLRGGWSATVGDHQLGGTWTAEPHDEPDAAYGAWSLLDRTGKRLATGTWSARKAKGRWEGAWQAEADRGRKHAGSWTARSDSPGSSPLIELFRAALDQVVNGTWKSGSRLSGTWSIQADR